MELLAATLIVASVCSLIAYLPLVVWRVLLKRASGPTIGKYTGTVLALTFGLAFGGFVLGFFGPIFLDPGGAQGPLLGIFITGPLGGVAGLISTWVWFYVHRKNT